VVASLPSLLGLFVFVLAGALALAVRRQTIASAALAACSDERDALRVRAARAEHLETRSVLLGMATEGAIWDWDAGTDSLEWIGGSAAHTDLPATAATWAAFTERIAPGDRARCSAAVREQLEHGAPLDIEVRLVPRDGTSRWVRLCGRAARDAAGRAVRMAGTLSDVTERHFAEERQRASEESFRSLSAASPTGVFKTDAEGGCTYCNERWQQIMGLDEFDAMGDGWLEAVHPDARARVCAGWAEYAQAGDASYVAEFPIRRPDGEERWVRALANPTLGLDGRVTGHVGTTEDITEARRSAAALVDAGERAMAAARAKSEFLANMSHEIRTPLNGVVGMTELMLGTPLTDEQQDHLRTIHICADALLNIINDILDFSKIEAGKLHIECVPLDLRALLEDSADLVAVRARERGLELLVQVDPRLPRHLTGDPVRLRQIAINLASNAIKFTERGEVVVGADLLHLEGDRAEVRMWVRDTGIGIPADRLGAVFESFTQADGSTTRRFGGTGLGLTICRQLAQLMGGSIHVESTVGMGSTFEVRLPLRVAAGPVHGPVLEVTGELRDCRMLVVDDHALARQLLVERLQAWGCRADAAASGEEAVRRVADEHADPYAVILLDDHMPGWDGHATAERLAALPGAERRVVMMLSASAALGAGRPGVAGVRGWLGKPVREHTLHRTLCAALGLAPPTRGATAGPPGPEPAFAELAILLAEDNEVNRKVALRMLERVGARAEVVGNGREALDRTAEQRWDLVLMDCQMPEMDGFEATAAIRAREAASGGHLRIVAMTANAMEGDRERCLAAGMDDYVAKPVRLERLVEQLHRVLADRDRRAAA
jgi:PAS domain S-box-containing protein